MRFKAICIENNNLYISKLSYSILKNLRASIWSGNRMGMPPQSTFRILCKEICHIIKSLLVFALFFVFLYLYLEILNSIAVEQ